MTPSFEKRLIPDKKEIAELFRYERNPETPTKTLLWILALITPFGVAGALYGYARAHKRFLKEMDFYPSFAYNPPIVRFSMIVFGIIGLVLSQLFFGLLFHIVIALSGHGDISVFWVLLIPIFLNLIIFSVFVYPVFKRWRIGVNNLLVEGDKFGTARFARPDELDRYKQQTGIYIGGDYRFSDKGHILTVAGTRGGKGTNLIIPNLLGVGGYQGSWVVIDPKGENAAITARYQRESGQNVVVLNPWGLLEEQIGESHSYNPLDILADKSNIHLVDDVQIIAEMIVPIDKYDNDKFFTDNARSIVAGLLLYLVTEKDKEERTLSTLWTWVRYQENEWNKLLSEMAVSDDPVYGKTIKNAANEIIKLMQAGDKTYGSIIATVLQCTEFLKSPALQKALQSGFAPGELADGNTTLYVIIPADKLQSHARWLRLVVTTTMRAVVRKPNKRVTFLLDEFSALGYLPEIEIALSTYAGFEISVWAILQSLIQLKGIYHDSWETFTANCTIRQYFTVNDNFTAAYVSEAMGQTTHVITKGNIFRNGEAESNPRALATPDEIRRSSGRFIFAFIGENPPTLYMKLPYYQMTNLIENGKKRYDENPYITPA